MRNNCTAQTMKQQVTSMSVTGQKENKVHCSDMLYTRMNQKYCIHNQLVEGIFKHFETVPGQNID